MLKSDLGDTNCVKCIVCLTVKGKDVILGLKSNMFKKHMGKTKVVWYMPHLGKKEAKFYVNENCSHANNEVIYFQGSHISITEQVIKGSLKGGKGRKR